MDKLSLLSDSAVLDALSAALPPTEIAQTLSYTLRVPEAWLKIHEPTFLQQSLEDHHTAAFTPSEIAFAFIGGHGPTKKLQDHMEARLHVLMHAIAEEAGPTNDFEDIALLAIGIARKCEIEGGTENIANIVLNHPHGLRSALACSWKWLQEPHTLIAHLLEHEKPEGIALAAHLLLANVPTSEAAKHLLTVAPQASSRILLKIRELGELDLANEIASSLRGQSEAESDPEPSSASDTLILSATRHLALGELDSARKELGLAWERASQKTAEIADQVADAARIEGDLVLETEARQQALTAYSTPVRRASLALALLELGRIEDALTTVHRNPACIKERIASGLVLVHTGEAKQAENIFTPAVQRVGQEVGIEDHWLRKLMEGLRAIGNIRSVLHVARVRLERTPTNIDARTEFVRTLESAGDPHTAAEQAALTLALDPNSRSAKILLASNLQHAGLTSASLPHWQALAADEPQHLWELAECALQADALEIAEDTAQRLSTLHSDDVRASILLGKVQTAHGRFEIAREYLENAVRVAPEMAEAWIALAECQTSAGDLSAASETLSQAIQQEPKDGALQSAMATLLTGQGRLNDAKTFAHTASELEPGNVQRLMGYAHILIDLGHLDDALPILREALSQQPENWEVRVALGKTYELRNEPKAAAGLMAILPANAPPEAHFLAGRVLIQSTNEEDDSNLIKGYKYLQDSRHLGISDPTLEYWLGRAQELMGQNDQAFLHYQSSLQDGQMTDQDTCRKAVLGAARAALATDQVHLALSTLEAARDRLPASMDILNWLAKSYLAAGLPDKAMQVAYQATELDPSDIEPLRILCASAAKAGDWEKAIQATEHLLDAVPDDQEAWMKLSKFSHELGMQSEARDALARGLWLGRRETRHLQYAAQLLEEFQDHGAAQRILLRTASLEPKNPRIQEQLARISEEVGELETAQRAWRRCVELEPDNLIALDRGAETLWKLGRRSTAIGLWQRAIGIDKANPDLNIKLARAHIANGEVQNGLNHYQQAIESRPTSAELAIEAGSVVLRYGAPQEAEEVLRNAVQLAPDLAKPVVDLAECLIKLGRFGEAQELLERAKDHSHFPPRTDALLALIALEEGDLALAKRQLISIREVGQLSLEDAICISNAALRMGLWNHAVDVLEETSSDDEPVEKLVELVRLQLRLADAYWLYAVTGKVTFHAPNERFTGAEAEHTISSLLERCTHAGVSVPTIDRLKQWAAYSLGDEIPNPSLPAFDTLTNEAASEQLHAHAIAHLKAGQHELAAQLLRSTPESLNPDAWGALLLGLSYVSSDEKSQAFQAFEIAARNPVVQPLAWFLSSQANWAMGQREEAIADLNSALSAWPEESTWHYQLASMYEEQARYDTAIPHLQEAIALAPGNGDYLSAYARALRHSGQLSESLTVYKQLLQDSPEDSLVWKEAAQIAIANGEAKTAQAWFERASTLSPSDPACLIGAARAAMMQGHAKEAMEHAQSASRIAPDDLDVLIGMGEILAKQGKYEKALRAYDQVMKRTNDQLNVRIARSKLLLQIGRANHAISDLQDLLEDRPQEDRLWAALAEAHEANDAFDAAIEAASQATRLSPRESSFRLLMGRLCRRSGQLDRALDELLQAQTDGTTNAHVSRELGLVYEQRREMARALEAFQRALRLDPEDEQSHYMAGLIFKQQKAYQQAARMFERAVEINPKDSDALQQLAAVRALELVHGGI